MAAKKSARKKAARKGKAKEGAEASPQGGLGFEAKLWAAADLLRNNVDPAEYKHVVLGLLFLKYIEDAFEERRGELAYAVGNEQSDYYVQDGDERAIWQHRANQIARIDHRPYHGSPIPKKDNG